MLSIALTQLSHRCLYLLLVKSYFLPSHLPTGSWVCRAVMASQKYRSTRSNKRKLISCTANGLPNAFNNLQGEAKVLTAVELDRALCQLTGINVVYNRQHGIVYLIVVELLAIDKGQIRSICMLFNRRGQSYRLPVNCATSQCLCQILSDRVHCRRR